jgi:hypothetical protein
VASKIAPLNKIQCEYRTLDELAEALNRTLYWKRVALAIHELDGFEPDRMKAGFGAIYAIALEPVPGLNTEMRVSIHVHGYGHINIRNTPLVFDGVEYPSEIYIEGDHVSVRRAYAIGEGEYRKVVKGYYVITALRSLDD